MRVIFHLALLTIYISYGDSSLFTQLKDSLSNSVSNLIDSTSFRYEDPVEKKLKVQVKDSNSLQDKNLKHRKAERPLPKARDGKFYSKNFPQKQKKHDEERIKMLRAKIGGVKKSSNNFRMDPVLNFVNRRTGEKLRRRFDSSDSRLLSTSASSSSSLELRDWKDEWREHWINKKIEALNSTGQPRGDVINMVAARPWGVPCGDPDQHDMPWGNCMLPLECEPEYRIFRGDYFCGRTKFVCCAIQLTNYDMYQGFDVSFADSGLTTSSDERKNKGKNSRERRRRKRRRAKQRRRKARAKRKKKIKKNIRKIIREMRKILNRSYRNGTTARKKKTKQLKKFIKDLKKKYRSDRNVVSVIHEKDLIKIDDALMKRLNEIRGVNANFIKNSTFRDIVVNGTLNKKAARMLMEAYPELAGHLKDGTRRSHNRKDYLDYDIEYGMLYY